jgi:hypothetical protein
MPRICEFYGIVISMYYSEPHALPHFHAWYSGSEATIAVDTGAVVAGDLPGRAMRLVREWAGMRRHDLLANWDRARQGRPLRRVDPLP